MPFNQPILNDKVVAASEERLRALVTAISNIIYRMNPDWSVMWQLDGQGILSDTQEPITDWLPKYIHPQDHEKIKAAIDEAIRSKRIFHLEHRVLQADGKLGWTLSRAVPILDEQGEIIEWFGAASDITERKQAEETLRESKERSEQQKRLYEAIASSTPDLIYVFDLNYRFTYANSALLSMWGKTWDNAIGKSLLENGYEPWHAEMHEREIDQVKATKQSIRGEVSFPHITLGRRFYDYIFTPVFNEHGEVEAIAGTTRDITERKLWEQKLESSSEQLQSINEEIASSNEEMASTNEELTAANEELLRMQQELQQQTAEKQDAIDRLSAKEQHIRNMVRQAPVGMCIVEGDPLYVVEVNDRFLEIIGKSREELNKRPYWELNAEAAPYYEPITSNVLSTGQTYHANEHEIMLIRKGVPEIVHVNFVYEPIRITDGTVDGIMIVAMEVTDQVIARKELEAAYEQVRLSKQAAQLGTFDMDLTKGTMIWDDRCRQLFGIAHEDTVTYEKDFLTGLHPDDRERVIEIINNVFIKSVSNGDYDMEYRTIGVEDQRIRWIRAKGKAYFDEQDLPYRFIGSVLDITDVKENEIRKNDFIGMVSHELKTPLTSLTVIIQVLNSKLKNHEDEFIAGAAEKANIQVKKMTNLINGFLNVSRLEAGKIVLDIQNFVLNELIEELIEEITNISSSHTISLIPCSIIMLSADRDKIGSVISNLLTNAVKYSPKGKLIEVKCEIIGNDVQVAVRDEGIGIKPQEIGKLFDRFYRVETHHTSHISGFGIGLYLSAEIIKRHHGKIWAESQSSIGSTFFFIIPLINEQDN